MWADYEIGGVLIRLFIMFKSLTLLFAYIVVWLLCILPHYNDVFQEYVSVTLFLPDYSLAVTHVITSTIHQCKLNPNLSGLDLPPLYSTFAGHLDRQLQWHILLTPQTACTN